MPDQFAHVNGTTFWGKRCTIAIHTHTHTPTAHARTHANSFSETSKIKSTPRGRMAGFFVHFGCPGSACTRPMDPESTFFCTCFQLFPMPIWIFLEIDLGKWAAAFNTYIYVTHHPVFMPTYRALFWSFISSHFSCLSMGRRHIHRQNDVYAQQFFP
jgi:hypothetical protein